MDEVTKRLKDVLTASGVVQSLVFHVDEDGRQCFIDSSGYRFCWEILPMEFTFEETIALSTPTLPSLKITISSPEVEESTSFELPMNFALLFLRSSIKELEHLYIESMRKISGYVKMNNLHKKASDKMQLRADFLKKNSEVVEDDRDVL